MASLTRNRGVLAACTLLPILSSLATANNDNGFYCPSSPPLPANLTNTTISGLPSNFFPSTTNPVPQNVALVEQIRYTLNLYPLIIDGRDFASLNQVFAPNAVANYSAPLGVLAPLSTIEATLAASLAPVTTQHSLTTQVIEIFPGECTARSVTYYTAAHFGVGVYEGEVLYAYGQYRDVLVRLQQGWRVQQRTLAYMGSVIGNASIFSPQ